MPINQAARLVRAFRIAFRAARILATDPELPWLLRILFVIGAIPVPFSPVDEVAAVIALAWLLVFHRDRLAHAVQAARVQPEPKEHTMSRRKLAVVSAALAAVLAVVVSFAVGAVPAFASSHRVPLAAAVVTVGREVRAPQPSCRSLLSAYRTVSRQAGVVIGSTHVQAIPQTGPRSWARVLRRAGDYPLAAAALGIHDRRSDRDFVMALTASAAAALEGSGCR